MRNGENMKRILLLSIIGLILMVDIAGACMCDNAGQLIRITESKFIGAHKVFVGKVTDMYSDGRLVKFEIIKSFKGVSTQSVEIKVINGSDALHCGYPFEKNEEYLVFSFVNGAVAGCGITRKLSEAKETIGVLDQLVSEGFPINITWDKLSPEERRAFDLKWNR